MKEQPKEPEFMKSVNELSGLAASINSFQSRLQDLMKHVDFIQNDIDIKFSNQNSQQQQQQQQQQQRDENAKSLDQTPAIVSQKTPHQSRIADTDTEKKYTRLEITAETEPDRKTEGKGGRSRLSELQHLVRMMCSRGLRKYVVSHLLEIQNLRGEAILALKSAPNPAKLVLDCVGRFFLQGIRAYTKDSPMISSRQASVFVLELFLSVIGESEEGIEIEKLVKQEAEKNAIAWRKRLISEGGVRRACEIDARGLLLFIACFGIPKAFNNEDVRDLIRFSNLKEIGHLLKGSRVLVAKTPDIIENMKKNGMHVEAVDIVYTFGIDDKFSPHTILVSFLQESKETWRKTKRDAPIQLKEANEKHLAALNSVIKCLEDRKIDPAQLLPGCQIKDRIVKLEKDVTYLNQKIMAEKIMPKRKAGEIESSNKLNRQEMKRSRFTPNGSSLMSSPDVLQLHDPRTANYADGKSSYDGLTPNLLNAGFSGYTSSHPAVPAASHAYKTGPLADLGTTVGGGSSVHAIRIAVGMSPRIGTLPTGSFVGREMSVDKIGQTMYANGSSYGWHGARDAANNDRIIGQSFTRQPGAIEIDGLYRPSPSLERFAGLLDPLTIGFGNQNSASDLYSFADSVI